MTKVSVFGQEAEQEKKKKPIEFVKYLNGDEVEQCPSPPSDYENLVLLEKNYYCIGFDLMWAHNDSPNDGTLYLGHWNDGVV